MTAVLVAVAIVLTLALVVAGASIRVLREYERAVDQDLPERGRRLPHHADVADERLGAGSGARASDRQRGPHRVEEQGTGAHADRHRHRQDQGEPAAGPVDGERGARDERGDTGDPESAERGQMRLGDQ